MSLAPPAIVDGTSSRAGEERNRRLLDIRLGM
jgi:hypothetical protein